MTTPSNPMSVDELRELAALDALALLDDYETALFNRSFHLAAAGVQDEIKDLQAAIAADTSLMPGVEPPEELRRRVLAHVARAVDDASGPLAPIAAIGRPRREETAAPQRATIWGSAQIWRAASFLLATSLLVGLLFGQRLIDEMHDSRAILKNELTERAIEDVIGWDARRMIEDPATKCIRLEPIVDADDQLEEGRFAILYINEETEDSCLVTFGLDRNEEYKVTGRVNGVITDLARFACKNRLQGHRLADLTFATVATMTIEITDASGAVVLRS